MTVTDSAGPGTLRQAILNANAKGGTNRIEFALDGFAPFIIAPDDTLPPITAAVTIDATTQPGYKDRPLIALSAVFLYSGADPGLEFDASGGAVKGLSVVGFGGAGILIKGANNCRVDRCFLGLLPDGSAPFANTYGVALANANSATVTNCVLSGNSYGAYVSGNSGGNTFQNCVVGMDIAGGQPAPNVYGLIFDGANVRNNSITNGLISGNSVSGLTFMNGASANTAQSCQIGLSAFYDVMPNGADGVDILNAPNNQLFNNLIVGSPQYGILISGSAATGNLATGNVIYDSLEGVSIEAGANGNRFGAPGQNANLLLGNFDSGIRIVGAGSSGNIIANNTISGNSGNGALIASSNNSLTGNQITGNVLCGIYAAPLPTGGFPSGISWLSNVIHDNGDLGIRLSGSGASGANHLQAAPLILSANSNSTQSFLYARLNSAPNTTYTVQFFATLNPDPSGYGQADALLGSGSLTTDSTGAGSISLGGAPADMGAFVSAVAISSSGDSSEFSLNAVVGAVNPAPVITQLNPASVPAGSGATRIKVIGSNFVPLSVVRWNGQDRATSYVSATEIDFTAPPADLTTPGTARIVVFSPEPGGGLSFDATFTIAYPKAVLTSLSPSSVVKGSAGFTLSIRGSGFYPGSVVLWNGLVRPTVYVSASLLTIDVPASDLATAAILPIAVRNPQPGGGDSDPLLFTVANPVPVLTLLSPNSVTAGTSTATFTLTGSNFLNTSVVKWNGQPLTTFYVSPTALRFKLGTTEMALPGVFNVSVSNPPPGGGDSTSLPFTVNGFPQVSLTSAVAVRNANGSVNVTLVLRNFGTAPAVSLRVTASGLNLLPTSDAMPGAYLPTLEANSVSAPITLHYPAGIPAGLRVVTVSLTSLGRALTASRQVAVP